jgi:hypothetical protein
VLQLSTPVAFQQALGSTEQWVISRAYAAATAADTMVSVKEQESTTMSQVSDYKLEIDRNGAFSGTMSDDSMSPVESPSASDAPAGTSSKANEGPGVGFLDRFKQLGSKIFTAAAPAKADVGSSAPKEFKWPHDSKIESDTMCLWSSADEVVPFISSSSRAALPPFESIQHHFHQGVLAVSERVTNGTTGTKLMTLPPLTELSYALRDGVDQIQGLSVAGVTYFGIDCRDERERSLGLFPRVGI